MTLEYLLYSIGKAAIRNKIINYAAAGGSIYELNAETIQDYPILFASPTGQHEVRVNTTDYEISLYYLDRLLRDNSNDIQIYSTAVENLKLTLRAIEEIEGVIEISETYNISNFTETEAMNDRVAGAFATVTITILNTSDCDDIEVIEDFNKLKLQNKTIEITENGVYSITYDNGFEGLEAVEIDVEVPDLNGSYEEGYTEGKTDGIAEGFTQGKEEGLTEGYSNGLEVGKAEGYTDGYAQGQTEGVEAYKETLPILEITENGSYDTVNKGVNVNVIPKVNVNEYGLKFAESSFTTIPSFLDFEGVTNAYHMFHNCSKLTTVSELEYSQMTDMKGMFQGCTALTTIEAFNCENATQMSDCFYNCSKLTTLPDLNSGKNTTFYDTLGKCSALISVGSVDCSSLRDGSNNAEIFGSAAKNNFVDFGGLINLKCKADSAGLSGCPNLTYESCINVLNGLYDFTGNGETPNSNQGKLKVHANFLTTVGEDISIGLNKGWTITS